MQQTFNIPVDLTLKESLDSTFYIYRSSKRVRRYLLLFLIIMIISQTLGWIVSPGPLTITSVLTILVPMVFMGLFVSLFIAVFSTYIYKSRPYLFRNVNYEFTHWGVTRYGEKTSFSKPWREITRYRESKNFFILYVDKMDFHVIQKRMFQDPFEEANFRDMLKENITHK